MNIRSKLHSVSAVARNLLLDLRYGGILTGSIPSHDADKGAYDTTNVQYSVLPVVFRDRIKDTDVIVDVGCGKGRVINWLLSRGLHNPIIGIELNKEVAAVTKRRLSRYRNVQIIAGDAVEKLPSEGTVFFLFNPFNAAVMSRFRDRLLALFGKRGGITVLYYAPVHLDVFRNDPNWVVQEYDLSQDIDSRFLERHRKYAVIRLRTPATKYGF